MSDNKVPLTAKDVAELYASAVKNGTLIAWARLALEWMGHAEAEIVRLCADAPPAPAQPAIITPDVPPLDIHSAAARIWQALQGVDLRKQDPVPVIAQALADAAIQHVGAPAQPASAEQQPVANRGTPGLQDVRVERTIIDRYPEINPSNYDHEAVCALNSWGFDVVMNARPIEDAPPALHEAALLRTIKPILVTVREGSVPLDAPLASLIAEIDALDGAKGK